MEELVGRHPDGIQEAVPFQVFINLWFGEGRIATKVFPDILALVPLNDWVQKFFPAVSAVNIAGAEQFAFTITPLVEAEQWMETGTAEGRRFVEEALVVKGYEAAENRWVIQPVWAGFRGS